MMSAGRSVFPASDAEQPLFLSVRPGTTVCLASVATSFNAVADKDAWWMGQVIWCEAGARERDPKLKTMFQISDVDTGVMRWINAGQVTHVLPTSWS